MIGNPVNYDKEYNGNSPIWGKSKLDNCLRRYLNLLEGKNILDLEKKTKKLSYKQM